MYTVDDRVLQDFRRFYQSVKHVLFHSVYTWVGRSCAMSVCIVSVRVGVCVCGYECMSVCICVSESLCVCVGI